MHFGLPPRFSKDVKIIQLDIAPETIGRTRRPGSRWSATARRSSGSSARRSASASGSSPESAACAIAEKAASAAQIAPQLVDDNAGELLPRTERRGRVGAGERDHHRRGASTMDIGRTRLFNSGRGTGSTPAATARWASAWVSSSPRRWCIPTSRSSRSRATRRSAPGMEIETACRYQLPVKIVVFNNGGIGPDTRHRRPTRFRP